MVSMLSFSCVSRLTMSRFLVSLILILYQEKAKTFATAYTDYPDYIKNQCNPRNLLLFGSGSSGLSLMKALPASQISDDRFKNFIKLGSGLPAKQLVNFRDVRHTARHVFEA